MPLSSPDGNPVCLTCLHVYSLWRIARRDPGSAACLEKTVLHSQYVPLAGGSSVPIQHTTLGQAWFCCDFSVQTTENSQSII